MSEIRVPMSALARGDRIVIEGDIDPITPISSLKIIPRRPNAPAGVLLTVETLAPRDFDWRRLSTGERIMVGAVTIFTRPIGFQFDIFGQAGRSNQWAVVYTDTARDRMIVTSGFYLVDWPTGSVWPA